jgi:type II secretory pathway pseudopilin PulG
MMTPHTHAHTRTRTSAFTLVELMVALTAGALVIASAFVVGAGSSRDFGDQNRIAQTQMSLRAGIEQLRVDIARAGFLASANTRRMPGVCIVPSRHVQAVEFANDVATAIPNASENGVSGDRLRLVGNFATADSYYATGINSTGDQITLQRSWQGFRRSFFSKTNSMYDPTAFSAVFRPGRMLHISTAQGTHLFVQITDANPATASINFTPSLPPGGACVGGLADGAMVSPLVRIEYLITDLGGSFKPLNSTVVGTPTQLVRREILFDAAGTPVLGTERAIAEFAVDFNLNFILDDELVINEPPVLNRYTGTAAANLMADVNTNPAAAPHRIRSILYSVSVRTPEQDGRFKFVTRQTGAPLTRYRADPQLPGSARVRTVVGEVFLANVAGQLVR